MTVELDAGVAIIRWREPRLSAAKLRDVFLEAGGDSAIRAMWMEAPGPVFCSEIEDPDAVPALFEVAAKLAKPLVVSVQGAVLSAGVGLVACGHVVVAAQGTSFGVTEIRGGSFPDTYFPAVARAIGVRRATELAITGRIFSAPEALQYGLVHQLAPPFEYDDRAFAIARGLAAADTRAIGKALSSGLSWATG